MDISEAMGDHIPASFRCFESVRRETPRTGSHLMTAGYSDAMGAADGNWWSRLTGLTGEQ